MDRKVCVHGVWINLTRVVPCAPITREVISYPTRAGNKQSKCVIVHAVRQLPKCVNHSISFEFPTSLKRNMTMGCHSFKHGFDELANFCDAVFPIPSAKIVHRTREMADRSRYMRSGERGNKQSFGD